MTADRDRSDNMAIEAIRTHFAYEVALAESRRATVPDIGRRRMRGGLRTAALLAAVGIAVVLVATTARFVVSPLAVPASPAALSPTATSAFRSSSTPNVPQGLIGDIGLNGTAAYEPTNIGFRYSNDAGHTWTFMSYAAVAPGVTGSEVVAAAVAPGRLWLAVLRNGQVELFRVSEKGAASTSVALVPDWPAWTKASGLPESVQIISGPNGRLTVFEVKTMPFEVKATAETPAYTSFTTTTTLFLSGDDGATFVQRPPTAEGPADGSWESAAFLNSTTGAAVTWDVPKNFRRLIYTRDGGVSWSNSVVPALPADRRRSYGEITIVGSDLVVARHTHDIAADGSTMINPAFQLLVSHDGGATFTELGTQLPCDGDSTTLGSTTWFWAGNFYQTEDSGQTWTTRSGPLPSAAIAAGLPGPDSVISVSLTGPHTATIVVLTYSGGSWGVAGRAHEYLMETTDNGATWHYL